MNWPGLKRAARYLDFNRVVTDIPADHPALYIEMILNPDPGQPLVSSIFQRVKNAPKFPYGVPGLFP